MVEMSSDWRLSSSSISRAATGAGDGIADAIVPKARAPKVIIFVKENIASSEESLKRSQVWVVELRGTWG